MVAAGRSRVGEWGHGVEGQASGRGPGCGASRSRRLSAAASQRAALASSLGGRRRSRGAGTATLVPRHGGTVVRQSLTRGQQALRVPHRRVRHHRLGSADDLGPPAWRSAAPQPHPRRPPALHHHLLHVTTQQHPPPVLLDACGSGAVRQGGKVDVAAQPGGWQRHQQPCGASKQHGRPASRRQCPVIKPQRGCKMRGWRESAPQGAYAQCARAIGAACRPPRTSASTIAELPPSGKSIVLCPLLRSRNM